MMHVLVSSPTSETFIPGALVLVPERFCLTYIAELIPHLRPGAEIQMCADDLPVTRFWRFTCG
jgi:hypothetical protein